MESRITMVRPNIGYFVFCLMILGWVIVRSAMACDLQGTAYLEDIRTLPAKTYVGLFESFDECLSCAEYEDQARYCEKKYGQVATLGSENGCDECLGQADSPNDCLSVCK